MSERLFYSPLQVADLLGVCRETIYRRVAVGDIPHVRVGNKIRIHRHTLTMLVNPGRTRADTAEVAAPASA